MSNKNIMLMCTIAVIAILCFSGCKKYNLKKIEHRWQMVEIPLDTNMIIWSFDVDGKVHWIIPNGTSEDTLVSGNYEMLSFDRVRIAGFAASFDATWKVAKNNSEIMILTTTDLGGIVERDFVNLDAAN